MSQSTPTGLALQTLLKEVFYGATQDQSWFLNPGDPGFVPLCKSVTAKEASATPAQGRQTIASHTRHVIYHLELITRTLQGEENVFESADWTEAWKHNIVTAEEWRKLIECLALLAENWISSCPFISVEESPLLTGSMGSAVHFGYHLGAIRQILLQVRSVK